MSTATTTTTTKSSPSPPPFSIAEFTSLVSAALDTDRFDPDSSQFLSFTRTSQKADSVVDVIMPHACLPTPFSTASMSTLDLNSESSLSPAPSRSPMALFQRIKRQATSAFVGKNIHQATTTTTHTRLTHPTTVSFAPFPLYHSAPRLSSSTTTTEESRPSFFEDDSDSDEEDVLSDAGRTEESDYIPYIPLIVQHERSLQNHPTLRPTIGIYPIDRSPPSPTPSGSTTSTRSPVTPLTPVFSQNHHHGGGTQPETQQGWSLCNVDDDGISLSMSASTDADADPFAKARVQIVRSSISSGSVYSLPSASVSASPPKKSKTRKHRPAPLAPSKPPPLCPLPTVPNSQMSASSSSENDSDSPAARFSPPPRSISPITQLHIGRQTVDCSTSVHRREREGHYVQTRPGKEWTLRLGVPSSPSPSASPSGYEQPPQPPLASARVPTVRVTLSDADLDKDKDGARERRRRVKSLPTGGDRSVLSQFQTKSQNNLRREEEGEKDWTLSLPLSVSLTRTLSFSRAEQQQLELLREKQGKEQKLGRSPPRSRVPSQASSNPRGRVASFLGPQQHSRSSTRNASSSHLPTHADKHLGAPSSPRTLSRSVSPSPSRWSASSPSAVAVGYVARDPSPAPRGPSPLIIPPSALAARAKMGKGLPPSSFATHIGTGRGVGSRASLVSMSSSSSDALGSSRGSLSSSRGSLSSSRVSPTSASRVPPTAYVYHPPSTASSSTSTSSTMSAGSKMSVTSATSTASSDTIVPPARASITITRAGEDLEFPMPPTYACGVVDRSPVSCSPRNSLSSVRNSLSSVRSSFSSTRNSLSSTRDSLTPPPPSINGRLTPPPARGTSLTLPRPSPSPSDSMWTDDDETETETETIYEDAASTVSGVYYSARSSFDF